MGVKKIVFHIVNSIKGGSGKSTVSFFLADHFNKREDCKAVIIDLDINGSSWINDHKVENFRIISIIPQKLYRKKALILSIDIKKEMIMRQIK